MLLLSLALAALFFALVAVLVSVGSLWLAVRHDRAVAHLIGERLQAITQRTHRAIDPIAFRRAS